MKPENLIQLIRDNNITLDVNDSVVSKKDRFKSMATIESIQLNGVQQYILGIRQEYGLNTTQNNIKANGSYKEAWDCFVQAVDAGNAKAQFNLALMNYYGHGINQDYQNAKDLFKKAAKQGHTAAQIWYVRTMAKIGDAKAQYNLALMYYRGHGFMQSHKKAYKWFHQAAEQENSNAQYNLALMYYHGQGCMQNHKEAKKWFRLAANQGNNDAQYNLALMYYHGEGGAQNYESAYYWFNRTAKEDKSDVLLNLGIIYYKGLGVQVNYVKARKCYEEAIIQEENPKASYNLGIIHYHGKGTPKNYDSAWLYFKKAAKQGHIAASYMTGLMYQIGKGTHQDPYKAKKYYKQAAKQGDVNAQYKLGIMHLKGQGIPKNYNKALYWLRKATTQKHTKALKLYKKAAAQGNTIAQYNLGVMYYRGQGVPKDHNIALYWFNKAIKKTKSVATNSQVVMKKQGLTHAKIRAHYKKTPRPNRNAVTFYELALKHYYSQGISKNYHKAKKYYKQAAKQGHIEAQYELGMMYLKGKNLYKNYNKALTWLKKTAKQNHAEAQYELGIIYLHRKKTPKDYDKALDYFKKAALQGHAKALKYCKKMAHKGNINAQYELGLMYYHGHHVTQNYSKALNWLKKAYHQGSVDAAYKISLIYENGGHGVFRNEDERKNWLIEAANKNHAEAQYEFAMEQMAHDDYDAAFTWFGNAARKGNYAEAQYELGMMFKYAKAVSEHYVERYLSAQYWLELAASQNHAKAQYELGMMYKEGQGITQNLEMGRYWLTQAATQGNTKAQHEIEIMDSATTLENKLETHENDCRNFERYQATIEDIHQLEDQLKTEELPEDRRQEIQNEIAQLKKKIKEIEDKQLPLWQEYQAKQAIIATLNDFKKHPNLQLFCNRIQTKLEEIFLGSKAAASELVEVTTGKITTIGKTVSFFGGLAEDIPFAGTIAKITTGCISQAAEMIDTRRQQHTATNISSLGTMSFLERHIEHIAIELTKWYKTQLLRLATPEQAIQHGVKGNISKIVNFVLNAGNYPPAILFAEFTVKWMFEALQNREFIEQILTNPDTLGDQLIRIITHYQARGNLVAAKNYLKTLCGIETVKTQDNDEWPLIEIFTKTGIETKSGLRYDGSDANPERYGYCVADDEEYAESAATSRGLHQRHQISPTSSGSFSHESMIQLQELGKQVHDQGSSNELTRNGIEKRLENMQNNVATNKQEIRRLKVQMWKLEQTISKLMAKPLATEQEIRALHARMGALEQTTSEFTAELLQEIRRLHARMEAFEQTARKNNPLLARVQEYQQEPEVQVQSQQEALDEEQPSSSSDTYPTSSKQTITSAFIG